MNLRLSIHYNILLNSLVGVELSKNGLHFFELFNDIIEWLSSAAVKDLNTEHVPFLILECELKSLRVCNLEVKKRMHLDFKAYVFFILCFEDLEEELILSSYLCFCRRVRNFEAELSMVLF